MKNCPKEKLILLINNRLSGLTKWQIERHTKSCPACQKQLSELTALREALIVATTELPSVLFTERLEQASSQLTPRSQAPSPLRSWLPAPVVGMLMGLFLTLWLITSASPSQPTSLRISFQSTSSMDSQEVLTEISRLKPNPNSKISSWSSLSNLSNDHWVELQVTDEKQAPSKSLYLWLDKIRSAPKLKSSNIQLYVNTFKNPSINRFTNLELKKTALFLGPSAGLTIGLIINFLFFLFKNTQVKLLIPFATALIGLIIAPIPTLREGPQIKLATTVQLTSSRHSFSHPLTESEVKLLFDILKPKQNMRNTRQLYHITQSSGFTLSQEHISIKLMAIGPDREALKTALMEWVEVITQGREMQRSGWSTSILSSCLEEQSTLPYLATIAISLVLGLLCGFFFGLLILFLMWIGNVLPGGLFGCIATGLALGLAGSALPTISKLGKPPVQSAHITVQFYEPGNALTPQMRQTLINGLLPASGKSSSPKETPSIGSGTRESYDGHYQLYGRSIDREKATKFVQDWADQIQQSRLTRLLGCRVILGDLLVDPLVHPNSLLLVNLFYGGFIGLGIGLFMGLTRRR